MYKVIANNCIMKFGVSLKQSFDVEKDEVKFAFNILLQQKRSGGQTSELTIPVVVNVGKLKINNTGGNAHISSAMSMASGKGGPNQEQKIIDGRAQVLDTSAVSHAEDKELLDSSFQSSATIMTNRTNQSSTSQQSA